MLGSIIWIIIIIVIINYSRNKNQNKNRNQNQNKIKDKNQNQNRNQNQNQNQNRNSAGVPYHQSRPAMQGDPAGGAEKAKQEELKRRLQQRYNVPPASANKQNPYVTNQTAASADRQEQDIFSKAAANADKDFGHNTYLCEAEHNRSRQIGMAADYSLINGLDAGWAVTDIMQKVQDLIVMGYQGNLQFERDFVGEAEDMLNNYQNKN